MAKSILVQTLSETALYTLVHNVARVTRYIKENETNEWVKEFLGEKCFIKKRYRFTEFELLENPGSKDKDIEFENSKRIYEAFKDLPRYILTDASFWLWLQLDVFYKQTRTMMEINSENTIRDHWNIKYNNHRGLAFGILSRLYMRTYFTVKENCSDKYELSRWVNEKPERYRNLSWRSFSLQEHLVRGIVQAEFDFVKESGVEVTNIYQTLSKEITQMASVKLLDSIDEKTIYDFTLAYLKENIQI